MIQIANITHISSCFPSWANKKLNNSWPLIKWGHATGFGQRNDMPFLVGGSKKPQVIP